MENRGSIRAARLGGAVAILLALAGMVLLLPFLWNVLWGGATPFLGLVLFAVSLTILWRLGHQRQQQG